MIVVIHDGVDREPLVLPATQVVICHDNGTPVCAAAVFGPDQALKAERRHDSDAFAKVRFAGDQEFDRLLRYCGFTDAHVEVGVIKAPPPPPGATILRTN